MEALISAIEKSKTGEVQTVTVQRLAQRLIESAISHLESHPEQWNTDTRHAAIGTLTQSSVHLQDRL